MHSSSVPLPSEGNPPFPPKYSHFLGSRACLDLFLPTPFLHTLSWLGLCTAEAVRRGRAPILPVFGGLRAEPGAVGPHGGRAWRGWDCCCILWREHSASVHVLSSPRPQSQSVLLPSLPLFNQRNPLSLSAPRAPRCQKHPPSACCF